MPLTIKIANPLNPKKAGRQTGESGGNFTKSSKSSGQALTGAEASRKDGGEVKPMPGAPASAVPTGKLASNKKYALLTAARGNDPAAGIRAIQSGLEIVPGTVSESGDGSFIGGGSTTPMFPAKPGEPFPNQTGAPPDEEIPKGPYLGYSNWWYPMPPMCSWNKNENYTPQSQALPIPLAGPNLRVYRLGADDPEYTVSWYNALSLDFLRNPANYLGKYQLTWNDNCRADNVLLGADLEENYEAAGMTRTIVYTGKADKLVQAQGFWHWGPPFPTSHPGTDWEEQVIEREGKFPLFAFLGVDQVAFYIAPASNWMPPEAITTPLEEDNMWSEPTRQKGVCGVPWCEDGIFQIKMDMGDDEITYLHYVVARRPPP